MWPTCGKSGYITPAVLGVPNAQRGDANQKQLPGSHVGKVATSPVPSRESSKLHARTKTRHVCLAHMWARWLHHPCPLGGPQCSPREQKSEIAIRPICGQSGYITTAVLGVPNPQRGGKNQKRLRGPHVGKVATSPLLSWGSPTLSAGTTIRNVYVAHMWAKGLHHPCRLGAPTAHCGGKNQKWLCGPHVGKVATSPLPPWGSSMLSAGIKIRNVCVGHMWAKWLYNPCCLGGPECLARGQKSQMSIWSTCGQGGYITPDILAVSNAQRKNISPAVSGVPNAQRGNRNQKCLRGPHVGKVATSPVPSWGPPTLCAGTKTTNSYVAHMWGT